MSYSRWNRNQPRSSVPLSRGGQSLTRASGRCTPCSAASSTRVEWRIAPVKCRCRCALGSASSGRAMASAARLRQSAGLGQQLAEPGDPLLKVGVAKGVGQPEVAGGPERLTGDHGDVDLVEDQLGEVGSVLQPAPGDFLAENPLDGRIAVERAFRYRADDARDL